MKGSRGKTLSVFYGKRSRVGDKIIYEREPILQAYLRSLPEDKRLEITIKKYVQKRSSQQNKYYWKVIINMISDETGADTDTVHSELKKRFLMIKDGIIPVIGSTKKLSTIEFLRYNDECVLFAAEFLGIIIPPPNYPTERT